MELQFVGRYQILSEIGRGAMGVVYKATDPILNRTIAIKTINLLLDPDGRAEYERRFQIEAQAAGSLNHPAIVTIYDLGHTGDLAYMVMELLSGRELRDMIKPDEPVSVASAISIAGQVAAGLSYAHHHGVVHRDIKPANIMVLPNGRAKITDFGIARMRVSEAMTQTGMRLGSPKYMSPEQVLGQRVDHRTDVFSLGIVLYEALTGRPPFVGSSLESLMYQTINVAAVPPGRLNAKVPQMLDLVVTKMLEKRPENRYQDAAELVSDLSQCQSLVEVLPSESPVQDLREFDAHVEAVVVEDAVAITGVSYSRHNDGIPHQFDPDATVIGISHDFDSFAATQRLAADVGMMPEFDEFAATLKLPPGESLGSPQSAYPAADLLPPPDAIHRYHKKRDGLNALQGLTAPLLIVLCGLAIAGWIVFA